MLRLGWGGATYEEKSSSRLLTTARWRDDGRDASWTAPPSPTPLLPVARRRPPAETPGVEGLGLRDAQPSEVGQDEDGVAGEAAVVGDGGQVLLGDDVEEDVQLLHGGVEAAELGEGLVELRAGHQGAVGADEGAVRAQGRMPS